MSKVKTQVDRETAESLLQESSFEGAKNLEKIKGGELAEVFFFEHEGERLVLRVHREPGAFEKDMYALKHFASDKVPIPEIIKTGEFAGGLFYAISKRVDGKLHDDLSTSERQEVLPALLGTLDEIHSTDISNTSGYGVWDSTGEATASTPQEILGLDPKSPAHRTHEELAAVPYLDRSLLDGLLKEMDDLKPNIPMERHLVHGDFGLNNLILADRKIIAVLDWGQSSYGDFIQDVVWTDFWDEGVSYESPYRDHCEAIGKEVANFTERFRCHKLSVTVNALAFAALNWDEKTYRHYEKRAKAILAGKE